MPKEEEKVAWFSSWILGKFMIEWVGFSDKFLETCKSYTQHLQNGEKLK